MVKYKRRIKLSKRWYSKTSVYRTSAFRTSGFIEQQ